MVDGVLLLQPGWCAEDAIGVPLQFVFRIVCFGDGATIVKRVGYAARLLLFMERVSAE